VAADLDPCEAVGWGLFARWHALIDARDPRFVRVSTTADVGEHLARLEPGIRVSMWNMQRHLTIEMQRSSRDLDAELRRKKVQVRLVLPRRIAERRCPLASSHEPHLRLAPVAQPLMIGDGRWVIVGDATGETVWTSTDRGVVTSAVALFDRVWRSAEPAVPDGTEPLFTRRMVDIAFLLVDGATDREIARALGVSERTVSADVREMSQRLGARSRAHAIALVSGLDG
jgi:DNA-binding CsgD family transcriptional regulator